MDLIRNERPTMGVGRQLEQARRSLGWSLRRAERASGVSNGYISQIEHGDVEPSPEVLRKLGNAYDIPIEVLMEEAGYIAKRGGQDDRGERIPAFVFSAAERFDDDDWDVAQAFFQALLTRKRKSPQPASRS